MTDSQPSAYRATADDWLNAETMAAHDSGNGYYALRCILELRARVEALETAQRKAAMDELRKASAELQSDHVPDAKKMIATPEAAPVATDMELELAYGGEDGFLADLRAVYDLGREHGATCPHIRSSDEGTSYCALAEQTAAAPAAPAAAPAPASSLVERVHNAILAVEDDDDEDDPIFKYTSAASRIGQGLVDLQARAAIREVAAWLRSGDAGAGHVWELVAVLLEQKANQ